MEAVPPSFIFPSVSDTVGVDPGFHGPGDIGLIVQGSRDKGDGKAGNNFTYETDSSSPPFFRTMSNIKSQIHFFKVLVKREWNSPHLGVEKKKSDNAQVCFSFMEVEFGAGGYFLSKDGR
ncbi:uncharacterized protein METZ01_LOCUS359978, partial [marine metagenome]